MKRTDVVEGTAGALRPRRKAGRAGGIFGLVLPLLATPPCPTFEVDGLRQGMSLAEVRRVMQESEDILEVSALGEKFETTAAFLGGGRSVAAVFPGKTTPRSKAGLVAIRRCVAVGAGGAAAFAESLRSQFGDPSAGGASLDAGLRGEGAIWSDPACSVEVRAFRKAQWWNTATEDLCVEIRRVETKSPLPAPTVDGAPAPESGRAATPVAAPPSPAIEPLSPPVEPQPQPIQSPSADVETQPQSMELLPFAMRLLSPAMEQPSHGVEPQPQPIEPLEVQPQPQPRAVERSSPAAPPLVSPTPSTLDNADRTEPGKTETPPNADGLGGTPQEAGVVTSPRLIASTQVRYPTLLRELKITARVVVRATILPDGNVGDVVVVENDRPGLRLEYRVVAAVRRWRYEPATLNGTPVTAEILIPFAFE